MVWDRLDGEDEVEQSLILRRRQISDEQFERFEGYMAEMFAAFGMDLDTPATAETPHRFVRALYDITSGYDGDPKLIKVFETECRGAPDCQLAQVVQGPIKLYALCEHHALPFFGHAYIGYIAHEHIIGISKLARLVRIFAQRFSVQERIGQQIAETLIAMLEPHGVAVYIEAQHMCMQMRGVHEAESATRTTVWRGEYADNPALRAEFFTACGIRP